METTKIIIDVDQNAAIRMGRKEYGRAVIEINPAELTPEQRDALASCYKYNDTPYPQNEFSDLPKIGEATIENAVLLINYYIASKADRVRMAKEKRESEIAYILQLPADEWIDRGRWGNDEPSLNNYINTAKHNREPLSRYINDSRVAEKAETVKNYIAGQKKEWQEQQARNKEEKEKTEKAAAAKEAAAEKAKEEKNLRKKTQITAWVEAKGTDNQKKRLSVNLLPDDEIIDLIRSEAFEPLASFPRYEKLTATDIDCSCGYYDDKKAVFDVEDATTATAEQFDLMEEIKALIPSADLTLRVHTGYCDRCNDDDNIDSDGIGQVNKYSVKVGIAVGEFYFTREYAV